MVNVIHVIINLIPYWGSNGERIVAILCTVDHPVRTRLNRQSGNRTVRMRKKTSITGDHGRDNHHWLPPVQTRTGAY